MVGYSGPALQVSIMSGTAVGDVAFDTSDNVSSSSLVTITTAGSGYTVGQSVVFGTFYSPSTYTIKAMKWYDQSGNANHAIPSGATGGVSAAPEIARGGVLYTDGSKASLRFESATGQYLQSIGNVTVASASSANVVAKNIASATNSQWMIVTQVLGSNIGFGIGSWSTDGILKWGLYNGGFSNITTSATAPTTSFVFTGTYGSTTLKSWLKGTAQTTAGSIAAAANTGVIRIGRRWNDNSLGYFDGTIQEIFVYTSVMSDTDRQALEANQGSFYTISGM